MKTFKLVLAISLFMSGTALCQVTADADTINNARKMSGSSARDGFTRYNADTLLTRNGVTEKVTREVILQNGLRVAPDGSAVLPNGSKIALRNNQILTLDGAVEDTPISQSGVAPMPSGGSATAGARPDVGIYGRDGITGSNDSAFITRNGITQQITSDLRLESGIRVQPNGTITLANGKRINLKPGQLLSFDGVVQEMRRR
jgi:uncharacterized protein YlzI (FlbEa/FlbD family)